MSQVLLVPPKSEPLTVELVQKHLNMDGIDLDLAETNLLQAFISMARQQCEGYTHRALITQTWQLQRDGWPGVSLFYYNQTSQFYVPKPPLQTISAFKFVDIGGVLQTLTACNADGTTATGQTYGYQLNTGGDTLPARLAPPWVRPWPPIRQIPANVIVEFVCGYADLKVNIVSITRSSGIVTVTTDAPCMGMVGGDVTIAGVVSATTSFNGTFAINSDPARVFTYKQAGADESGTDVSVATASAAASGVPSDLKIGMLLLIAFFYQNREGGRWMPPGGGTQGTEILPDTVRALWDNYRCLLV